jgi:hypothetical protein
MEDLHVWIVNFLVQNYLQTAKYVQQYSLHVCLLEFRCEAQLLTHFYKVLQVSYDAGGICKDAPYTEWQCLIVVT